jgi:hypothetical protein
VTVPKSVPPTSVPPALMVCEVPELTTVLEETVMDQNSLDKTKGMRRGAVSPPPQVRRCG